MKRRRKKKSENERKKNSPNESSRSCLCEHAPHARSQLPVAAVDPRAELLLVRDASRRRTGRWAGTGDAGARDQCRFGRRRRCRPSRLRLSVAGRSGGCCCCCCCYRCIGLHGHVSACRGCCYCCRSRRSRLVRLASLHALAAREKRGGRRDRESTGESVDQAREKKHEKTVTQN